VSLAFNDDQYVLCATHGETSSGNR